jgi:hypothetical protein
LIIVVNVALFFQCKDFIVGLRMVGCVVGCSHQKLPVVGGFLPFAAESMSDSSGCVVGCFLIVLVVSVVVILLVVVVVTVAIPIIVAGVVGIYSFWIVRVVTFSI